MSAPDPTIHDVHSAVCEAIEAALDAGMMLHSEGRCSLCDSAAEDVAIVLARLREAQTNLRRMVADARAEAPTAEVQP